MHADLQEIEKALQSGADSAEMVRIQKHLTKLQAELAQHCAEEDRGGCLDEAVSHCPRLSREVSRLEREHPQLLRQLAQLLQRVSEAGVERQFVEDYRQFARALHAHDAAETRIVREAFGYSNEGDD